MLRTLRVVGLFLVVGAGLARADEPRAIRIDFAAKLAAKTDIVDDQRAKGDSKKATKANAFGTDKQPNTGWSATPKASSNAAKRRCRPGPDPCKTR